MAVQIDIKDGARISRTKDGYRADRIAIVTGVTGTAAQRLFNAITDASLPAYGSAHPAISSIYLNDITGEVIDPETVRLVLSYYNDPNQSDGGETNLRVSSSTSVEQIEEDDTGERLQAIFQGVVISTNPDDPPTTVTGSKYWTAEVEKPRTTMDFSYTSSTYPADDIAIYQGAVNSTMWNGYPAGAVLCSAINIQEEAENYAVRLSFAINENGWDFKGAVKLDNLLLPLSDHPTEPDAGLDLYTGIKKFNLYPVADFSPLNLDIGVVAASLSGTAVVHPSIDGADIGAGGKTIIITLYNDTWLPAGASFDAQRQNIIDGITSNKSEANGWDAEVALTRILAVSGVARTSDTVVTITMAVDTLYLVTEREKITAIIPASALSVRSTPLTCKPTFSVNPE